MGNVLKHDDTPDYDEMLETLEGYDPRNDATNSVDDMDALVPDPVKIISDPVYGEEGWIRAILARVSIKPSAKIRYTPVANISSSSDMMFAEWVKRTFKERKVNGKLSYVGTPREVKADTISSMQKIDREEALDISDYSQLEYFVGLCKKDIRKKLAKAILFNDDIDNNSTDAVKPILTFEDGSVTNVGETQDIVLSHEYDSAPTPIEVRQKITESMLDRALSIGSTVMFVSKGYYLSLLSLTKNNTNEPFFMNVGAIDSFFGMAVIPVPEWTSDYKIMYLVTDLSKYTLGAPKEDYLDSEFDLDYNKQIIQLNGRYCGLPTGIRTSFVGYVSPEESEDE